MTTLRLRERQLQQHFNVNQENKEILNEKDKLIHVVIIFLPVASFANSNLIPSKAF